MADLSRVGDVRLSPQPTRPTTLDGRQQQDSDAPRQGATGHIVRRRRPGCGCHDDRRAGPGVESSQALRARGSIMKRTPVGIGAAAAALVFSGCYGMVTNHDTTVATRCTKEVGTLAPRRASRRHRVHRHAAARRDTPPRRRSRLVRRHFHVPSGPQHFGLQRPRCHRRPAGCRHPARERRAQDDPNAPTSTNLSTDPNTVPFWALPFNAGVAHDTRRPRHVRAPPPVAPTRCTS